jgi:hypothetical protein
LELVGRHKPELWIFVVGAIICGLPYKVRRKNKIASPSLMFGELGRNLWGVCIGGSSKRLRRLLHFEAVSDEA